MSRYTLPLPKCEHRNPSVIVSSHKDLVAAANRGSAHASALVCAREQCIEDAKAWVRASTRREPIVRGK